MNKEDIYKEQLKDLFNDFDPIIPTDGWERIENTLDKKNRIFKIKRSWYIGSAAAAVAILIASILFIDTPNRTDFSNQKIAEVPEMTEKSIQKTERENINQHTTAKLNKTQTVDKSQSQPSSKQLLAQADAKETYNDDPTIDQTVTSHKEEKSELSQQEIDERIKEMQDKANIDYFEDSYERETKTNKPVMLALNAKGGLTSSQKTANSPMRLRSASATEGNPQQEAYLSAGSKNNLGSEDANALFTNKSVADNNSQMIHSQPYSFGITISKRIVDKISLETGLVYTYLYSESRNSSSAYNNEENQQFHFIGVPLNINYHFVDIGKLDLYASLGGMIEKDVHGVYKGKDQGSMGDLTQSEGEISRNISLKNPQLSINAGVGASYPLYGGLNIYAKIGGAYYFDANNINYKTIYSDKKIMLDINAGIRFQF